MEEPPRARGRGLVKHGPAECAGQCCPQGLGSTAVLGRASRSSEDIPRGCSQLWRGSLVRLGCVAEQWALCDGKG